jgi:hypothetical protein
LVAAHHKERYIGYQREYHQQYDEYGARDKQLWRGVIGTEDNRQVQYADGNKLPAFAAKKGKRDKYSNGTEQVHMLKTVFAQQYAIVDGKVRYNGCVNRVLVCRFMPAERQAERHRTKKAIDSA